MEAVEVYSRVVHCGIVAPRDNLADLQRIDFKATAILQQMVEGAHAIRRQAALLVVCGVQMAEARNGDPEAWERFVEPMNIRVKGKDPEYRQIASVLFRGFSTELQGEGSLARRTVSRSQIARYGAAIEVVHGWFRKGWTDPEKLTDRIIKSGGVWTVAGMRRSVTASPDIRDVGPLDDPRDRTLSEVRTVHIPVPQTPTVMLVSPNGTYRVVPRLLAMRVLEAMEQ